MSTEPQAANPRGDTERMTDYLRSGRPSLDLAWTVRFRNVWPTETLTGTGPLAQWLRGTYPAVAFEPDLCTNDFLTEIKDLREAIYSLVRSAISREPVPPDDLTLLNRHAAGPRFHQQLGVDWTAQVTAGDGAAFLTELSLDAIDVLTADPSRLKFCEGPDCALPFLDESRGGSRRWCTAQRCGNRVNTKAYRRRIKG